jgi:membrane associated rhomboid family serine protease
MPDGLLNRVTPWVGRLIAINAVVLLVQQTILPSPVLLDLVTFDPALALRRPWTFASYMFVHGGLLHLVGNSLALFVFGPPVERRLGGTTFLMYYLFCGLGAAVTSLLLWVVAPAFIAPFIGASGAVLGVAFAFARFHPNAELYVFPLPMPIKARTLVAIIAGLDLFGALMGSDGVAHVAHLGGLLCGWLFFSMRGGEKPFDLPHVAPHITRQTVAAPVAAPAEKSAGGEQPRQRQGGRATPTAASDTVSKEAAEMNRLLDKISASGLGSLSVDERRFLDDIARRRRGEAR